MPLSEALKSADNSKRTESYDVRKEAENMVRRFDRQIRELRSSLNGSGQEVFRSALMEATKAFKEELKSFLAEHGAEHLYEEMVGFVSGKVSEIVSSGKEQKGS